MPDTKKFAHILFAFMFGLTATFTFASAAKAEEDDSEVRGDMVRHQKKAEIVMSVFADGQEPGAAITVAGEVFKYKSLELLVGLKTEFAQTELEVHRPAGGNVKGYNLGAYAVFGLKLNFLKWLSLSADFGGGLVYAYTPEFIWEQSSEGYLRGVIGGNHIAGGLTWGAVLTFRIGRFGIGPGYLGGVIFRSPLGWNNAGTFITGIHNHHHFTVNGSVEF